MNPRTQPLMPRPQSIPQRRHQVIAPVLAAAVIGCLWNGAAIAAGHGAPGDTRKPDESDRAFAHSVARAGRCTDKERLRLVDLLSSADGRVAGAAMDALAELGPIAHTDLVDAARNAAIRSADEYAIAALARSGREGARLAMEVVDGFRANSDRCACLLIAQRPYESVEVVDRMCGLVLDRGLHVRLRMAVQTHLFDSAHPVPAGRVAALLDTLTDEDRTIAAILQVGVDRMPGAAEALLPWLRHREAGPRAIATGIAAKLPRPDVPEETLRALLDGESGWGRMNAALLAGRCGWKGCREWLVPWLRSDDPGTRVAAYHGLAEFARRVGLDETTRAALQEAALKETDDDADVGAIAALEFARADDPRVLRKLIWWQSERPGNDAAALGVARRLGLRSEELRTAAEARLRGGPEFGHVHLAVEYRRSFPDRGSLATEAIIRSLQGRDAGQVWLQCLGCEDGLPVDDEALAGLLRSKLRPGIDPTDAARLCGLLGRRTSPSREDVAMLASMVDHPTSEPLRRIAAGVLGRWGVRAAAAVPTLRDAVARMEAEGFSAAAVALVRCSPSARREAVDAARLRARMRNVAMRMEGLRALTWLGDPAVVPLALAAAATGDSRLVREAAVTLATWR